MRVTNESSKAPIQPALVHDRTNELTLSWLSPLYCIEANTLVSVSLNRTVMLTKSWN